MKKILPVVLLLTTVGCTSHFADFTAISTRDVTTKEVNLNKLPVKKNVEGQNRAFWSIFTPMRHVSLSKAVEDALNKGDGDLIVNAEVTLKRIFVVIGAISTLKIKGDVVNTKAGQEGKKDE